MTSHHENEVDAGERLPRTFDLTATNTRLTSTRQIALIVLIAGGAAGEGFIAVELVSVIRGANSFLGVSFEGEAMWLLFAAWGVGVLSFLAWKGPLAPRPLHLTVSRTGFTATYPKGKIRTWKWVTFRRPLTVIQFGPSPDRPKAVVSWIQLNFIGGIMVPDEACPAIVASAREAGWKVKISNKGFPKNTPGTETELTPL